MKKLKRDIRGRNDIRSGLGIDVPESFLETLDWKTKGMPKQYTPKFEVTSLGQKVNLIAGRRLGDPSRADIWATQGFNIPSFSGQINETPIKDMTSWNKKKKINSNIFGTVGWQESIEKTINHKMKYGEGFSPQERAYIAHQQQFRPRQVEITFDKDSNNFTPTRSDDYLTAAQKFGARNLKRLPKLGEGRDRIVYALDQDKVLKIAKNPKGLEQNEREQDLEYLEGLKHHETGKDFVVMERAQKPGRSTTTMLRGLRKAGMTPWTDDPGTLSGIFEKAGVSQEYLNYDLSPGDFLAKRNWGEKGGVPVLIDAGTLSSQSTKPSKIKAGAFGRGYSQDPEWREVQHERRAFKNTGKTYPYEEDKYANKPNTPYPEATHALRDWPRIDSESSNKEFRIIGGRKDWAIHHLTDQRRTAIVNQMLYGDQVSNNMALVKRTTVPVIDYPEQYNTVKEKLITKMHPDKVFDTLQDLYLEEAKEHNRPREKLPREQFIERLGGVSESRVKTDMERLKRDEDVPTGYIEVSQRDGKLSVGHDMLHGIEAARRLGHDEVPIVLVKGRGMTSRPNSWQGDWEYTPSELKRQREIESQTTATIEKTGDNVFRIHSEGPKEDWKEVTTIDRIPKQFNPKGKEEDLE
jgi:hypothetical protein